MRLTKMLGLAAVAAIAAMAFIGASSAMAEFNTALCSAEELECAEANLVEEFTMLAKEPVLLTSVATVLCLHSKATGVVENETLLGTAPVPLLIQITELTWENCGTNAEHNNCTVENLELPLFDVLKIAEGLGTATALGALVHVTCPLVNCYYGGTVNGFTVESALHTEGAGHGMFNANGVAVGKHKGFLCPAVANWDALYEPLEHLYLES